MLRRPPESLDPSVPVVVLSVGYVALAVARSLGRLRVPVIGVHRDLRSTMARSRYWTRNLAYDFGDATDAAWERFADWLVDAGRSIGSRPVLLPTDDSGVLFVADHADVLGEAFRFPRQTPGLARALSDKASLYRLCRAHGVPTAETLYPESRDDVVAFARSARFPVVIKGIDTHRFLRRVGERVVRVDDAASLLRRYDEVQTPEAPNVVLQEYVPGGWEQMWIFHGYFDGASECRFHMTALKMRQHPPSGGVTTLGVTTANPVLAAQSIAFLQALGYHGITDLDYKYDARTGEYKLLDVNSRAGANFRLSVDARGSDVIRSLYRDLTGQPVPAAEPRDGRKWVVEDLDVLSWLRGRDTGGRNIRHWMHSLGGVEEGVWLDLDDPAPLLARGVELTSMAVRRVLRRGARNGGARASDSRAP